MPLSPTPPGSFFGPATLVDLLRHRSEHQGDERAFTFLVDGDASEAHVTYAELDRQARGIAARLVQLDFPGERALLLYPAGLEFIAACFGCMYAGVVAVPAQPPRRNRSLHRLQAIAEDARAKIVLTTGGMRRRIEPLLGREPELATLRVLATDRRNSREDRWKDVPIAGDTLAVLQYTSGSTDSPKGVMLTHANLLHNSALIAHAFEHTRSGTGVFWLPGYHDMGFVGGILQPLYVGRPNVLMAPMAFLQRPIRWLRAISRYGTEVGTTVTSGGPNFAYDLCMRKITPEQREGLDLRHWRVAFNGAEPVRPETMEAFAEEFAPCGFRPDAFYPCYGLAEATLMATGGYVSGRPVVRDVDARELEHHLVLDVPAGTADGRRVVGCGHTLPDQQILIVHPGRRVRCPENQVGEVWVRGPSVAGGYWRRPDETRRVFQAHLSDTGEGPFLRTGDLGFLRDGELFVTGRLKDLIIIHGLNHYPQDIEATVAKCHPALRSGAGAAFTIEQERRPRLVVVQEIARHQQHAAEEATSAIRRQIDREHGLVVDDVVLIRAGSIPKTSSGKIQRHACRQAFLHGTLECGDLSPLSFSNHADNLNSAATVHRESTSRPPLSAQCFVERQRLPRLSARSENESGDKSPHSKDVAAAVLAEVHRITHGCSAGVSLDASLVEAGLDSLARMELHAALERRFGGRFPEFISPELETVGQVVDAVRRHLAEPSSPRTTSVHDVPREHYEFEHFAEVAALARQRDILQLAGLSDPYFRAAEDRADGRPRIDFTSYDYLGLAHDPRVIAAAQEALGRYGTSVSGSRLVCGERPLHGELEQALARWVGVKEALAFVSGYATNVSVIGHLFGPGDLVLHDALAHNSIVQGCRLSGARRIAFPHNDWESLDRLLGDLRGEHRRVLVAIEGVYSMDGDIPELPRFLEVKHRHKALLMVDEAHSLGVLGARGRGIGEHFGINPAEVDVWMGTLSKALGSCGGFIAGSRELVQFLKYTAPGFVYSVGISPANAAAALAALDVLAAEPERVTLLRRRAEQFLRLACRSGLDTGPCAGTPVVPILLGDPARCLRLWQSLVDRGIHAQPILPPAVPDTSARLRFFITQAHAEDQIRTAVEVVANELRQLLPARLAAAG